MSDRCGQVFRSRYVCSLPEGHDGPCKALSPKDRVGKVHPEDEDES